MKKTLLALTALSLSFGLSACDGHNDAARADNKVQADGLAADASGQHKEHAHMMVDGFFAKIDKNGDGIITQKEYNTYARKWFKEADTNHDGKLTKDEVKAQLKREHERMQAKRHLTHDDMVSSGTEHIEYHNENSGHIN